ncbi:unnamed protein product [Prunus armeniaca]|uniref:Uncharacterized protein n=1 Tax=Prunus armeniaca TaxID=36596 RepID=A0A6J5TGI5_PRUAR|nr:unnamed protein product [Prunus armeniaca]
MPTPTQHWEPIGLFLKAVSSCFISASTWLKVRCSVADASFRFPGDIAEEIKVPWVAVNIPLNALLGCFSYLLNAPELATARLWFLCYW